MLWGKHFISILLIVLFLPLAYASEQYSFEKAEELKPLIEWREYGPEAFKESAETGKPIFLLLTAPSWCYWCQVYESEDYLFHAEVYPYLNQNFIPIYVDADQRQDITRQYLEGGWPSTTVLTPARERLFGYSGPRDVPQMLTWFSQAVAVSQQEVFDGLINYDYTETSPILPAEQQIANLPNAFAQNLLQAYDPVHGGFGTGQKFPQGRTLDFALEWYELTGDERYLDLVTFTLENQYTSLDELKTNYNLFDPVEGGFHRYGVARDWSPPHYEKMLYDNARLLLAYTHLQQLQPDHPLVDEVVSKTDSYIRNEWYEPNEGGFYANTDVAGEDAYYGENPRPLPKARVEPAKYADWNAEAIIAYLYRYEQGVLGEDILRPSLDFARDNFVTKDGAVHVIKEDVPPVRGNLLDNAYQLLAFTEAARILEDKEYLETAIFLADFSLDNLYDWNSGGFFERHSPDLALYAPGENVLLTKPLAENAVMAYAFLQLYELTENPAYLNAGLKTKGLFSDRVAGLDRGYYFVKAAQVIIANDHLTVYNTVQDDITEIEAEYETFWLDDLLSGEITYDFSEESKLQGPILLLLFVAFAAGLLSFLSPCTLPVLPAYFASIMTNNKKHVLSSTLAFVLGLSLVFSLLGVLAGLFGSAFRERLFLFTYIAGFVLIAIGTLLILGYGFPGFKGNIKKPKDLWGMVVFGGIMGLSWTPCVGPILLAILILAATAGSGVVGGLLLFLYAIGLAVPLIIISLVLKKLNKKSSWWKLLQGKGFTMKLGNQTFYMHSTSVVAGALFVLLGILIASGALTSLNELLSVTKVQVWVFSIEEKLLSLFS